MSATTAERGQEATVTTLGAGCRESGLSVLDGGLLGVKAERCGPVKTQHSTRWVCSRCAKREGDRDRPQAMTLEAVMMQSGCARGSSRIPSRGSGPRREQRGGSFNLAGVGSLRPGDRRTGRTCRLPARGRYQKGHADEELNHDSGPQGLASESQRRRCRTAKHLFSTGTRELASSARGNRGPRGQRKLWRGIPHIRGKARGVTPTSDVTADEQDARGRRSSLTWEGLGRSAGGPGLPRQGRD